MNSARPASESKTTVPYVSVGADTEQSSKTNKHNITQKNKDCNTFPHETSHSADSEYGGQYVISFEKTAKEVSVSDYVNFIGIPVNRAGMIVCPFHDDRNPSMKVDSRYHCFGCGADGNVIDFVSNYYGITQYNAACRIAEEFNLDTDALGGGYSPEYKEKIDYGYIKQYILNYLISVEKEMKSWLREYAPKPGDEEIHFLFRTAAQWLEYVSYLVDTLSGCKTADEIRSFISFHEGDVYARIIAFSNGVLDALFDKSEAFRRRQLVINVLPKDPDRIDDRLLSQKLESESEGILIWMLEGLKRLRENGFNFTISERTLKNLHDLRRNDNNIILFLESENYLCFGPDQTSTTKAIYRVYRQWCEDNFYDPFKEKTFSNQLAKLAKHYGMEQCNRIPVDCGKYNRGYKGVAVRLDPGVEL